MKGNISGMKNAQKKSNVSGMKKAYQANAMKKVAGKINKKPAESIGKKRKPGAGKGPIKKREDRFKIQPITRPKPRGR